LIFWNSGASCAAVFFEQAFKRELWLFACSSGARFEKAGPLQITVAFHVAN
jgi:hypothetical protein